MWLLINVYSMKCTFHTSLQSLYKPSPFTKDFHLVLFPFYIILNGTVQSQCFSIWIQLCASDNIEESMSSTDFSQIPHHWWGQRIQTSVFTSHLQTTPALLIHSRLVPFEKYYHLTGYNQAYLWGSWRQKYSITQDRLWSMISQYISELI